MIPYQQTTAFTTAASSLLTVMHHFNPNIELSKENEFRIWKNTANLPTRASSIFALANYARKEGLSSKIVVEKKEYGFPDYRFYRYTKTNIEQAAFSDLQHFREAEKNNLLLEEKEITLSEIKKELADNNILIIRLNTKPIREEKRNTSNYLVVHGYAKDGFQIIDPASDVSSISEEVMQEALDSLETKKYRDRRMLVFPRQQT